MHPALIPTAMAIVLLAGTVPALAQTPAPVSASAPTKAVVTPVTAPLVADQKPAGKEQLTERIHVDDGGSQIDEVRIGGETRSISVAPKGGLPVYDVQPITGARTWKVFGF